jgi:hypothetical protein
LVAYRGEMLRQGDLVAAVRRGGRELDVLRGTQFERRPEVVLSSEGEARTLKKALPRRIAMQREKRSLENAGRAERRFARRMKVKSLA